jgi:cell filamentation protein
MSKKYNLFIPDSIYTDPATGVLYNLLDITDPETLADVEASMVTRNTDILLADPLPIADNLSLFDIHHQLFRDIYAWAGQARTIEIDKGGFKFCRTSQFE